MSAFPTVLLTSAEADQVRAATETCPTCGGARVVSASNLPPALPFDPCPDCSGKRLGVVTLVVEGDWPEPLPNVTKADYSELTGRSIWLGHPPDSPFESRAVPETVAHVNAGIGRQFGTFWKSTQTHEGMTVWWWGGIHPVDFAAGWTAMGRRPTGVDRWGRTRLPPSLWSRLDGQWVTLTVECSTCGGRGWHTAGGNDPMDCGRCEMLGTVPLVTALVTVTPAGDGTHWNVILDPNREGL